MFLKSDFCNRNNLTFNACLNHMYEVNYTYEYFNTCIYFLESLNQIHRETRKKLRQQEQASKKLSHQKNDKVHISILSIYMR
jgi:xanthine dehydrogenase iron-sulfur cluster and FAD-binding subunit A